MLHCRAYALLNWEHGLQIASLMAVSDHLPQNKIANQFYYEPSFKSSLFLTPGTYQVFRAGCLFKDWRKNLNACNLHGRRFLE